MLDATYRYILVGGGLQNGLIALALLADDPGVELALVEQGPALGGNHTWCFHAADVPAAARAYVDALVAHRWDGYDIAFPELKRRLDTPYAAVSSERFDQVVQARLRRAPGCALMLDTRVEELSARGVRLADGRTLSGEVVIDARGPERTQLDDTRTGYQKFVGLELRLRAPHGRVRPVLMDATVPQSDGFRFFYTLPFGRDRLLLEDTYFSDAAALDADAIEREVLAYAAANGYQIAAIERRESGVLPLPWAGDVRVPDRGPLVAGYQGGFFHPVTGYSFPLAVRLAEYVAHTAPGALFGPGLARLLREHEKQLRFAHRLNKMLFCWFPPHLRYHVLERFYRLPEATIRRFYALDLTAGDRARILVGRPPRGLSLRAAFSKRRA